MTLAAGRPAARGMIGGERASPPKLAFAVSLYRSHALFRALIDLSVIGAATLLFASLTGAPTGGSRAAQKAGESTSAQSHLSPPSALPDQAPGSFVLEAARTTNIDQAALAGLAPQVAEQITSARTRLEQHDVAGAKLILEKLDPSIPAVIYAQAVASLNEPGPQLALEAMRGLRKATSQGFGPAFTLMGTILLRLAGLDERGLLPLEERATIDSADNAVPATRAQLIEDAIRWWERGAAFHDPDAIALLGMAEMRGYRGNRNVTAAVSHWRDAARAGNAAARAELGRLHLQGLGVDNDPVKAAEYFRDAVAQGFTPAILPLGVALTPAVYHGDPAAAQEAIAAVEQAIRLTDNPQAAALAHFMLGTFFLDGAPTRVRDPERSLAHYYAAYALGQSRAAVPVARAYRTGVGVGEDKAYAFALLKQASRKEPSAEGEMTRMQPEMSPAELERAQALKIVIPPLPDASLELLRREDLLSRRDGPRQLYGSLDPRASHEIGADYTGLSAAENLPSFRRQSDAPTRSSGPP